MVRQNHLCVCIVFFRKQTNAVDLQCCWLFMKFFKYFGADSFFFNLRSEWKLMKMRADVVAKEVGRAEAAIFTSTFTWKVCSQAS